MRHKLMPMAALFALFAAALLFFTPAVFADDDEDGERTRFKPEYRRESERQGETAGPPEPAEPPDDLVVAESAVAPAVGASRTKPGGRGPTDPVDVGDDRDRIIEDQAAAAAAWTANEIARSLGWREYYRVGFHRGMRVALQDDLLGGWDYVAGVGLGRRDSEARRMGVDIGREAAEEAAVDAAYAQVADQFHDLYDDPQRSPRPGMAEFVIHERWAAEPQISEVFVAYPVYGLMKIRRRARKAFDGWGWDAGRLYGVSGHTDFYNSSWRDSESAFRYWKDHEKRSSVYRRMRSRDDRDRFRAVFASEFHRLLPSFYEQHLRRGHREGFQDGWTYGAYVNREWHFRLGYTEGFDEGVASAAASGFQGAYPFAYERSYGQAFTEWSESPVPGIVSVRLADGNDDGIFQPGEEIFADYELANYGGRDGTYTVRLEGYEIDRAEETTVRLPARSLTRSDQPIRVRIDSYVATRTPTELDLTLGDQRETVGLMVSYPLEFPREVDLDSDSLDGRAVVRVLVVNRSRRPIDGIVDLERVDGYSIRASRDLGVLPAGAERWTAFEVEGIRPLDMISGDLSTHFTVRGAGVVQDRMEFRFPDAATDLHNRDLLELMVAFSRDPGVPWSEVTEARALLIRRLQVDWNASVRDRDNPYKKDFKQNGTRTALGDLVQTYLKARPQVRNSDVFEGLDRDVEQLAEDLPGTHPFLRKYMKRLARKLG